MEAMNTPAAKSGFSVALDIGTTKICAVIGRRNEHGRIEILGVGKADSQGVLRGVVSNIEKTVNGIREAINKAEKKANITPRKVHVGIAGQHIKSIHHRGILTRDNSQEEISEKDIQQLINDMYKLQLPPGEKIIHIFPQEFTVDSEQGIADPRGMSGVRLEANFHIVTGQITAIQNLERCITKAGLVMDDIVLEPIASATAVLSEEEMEAGVVLVDIGGGTTDISVIQEGLIRHTAVIPFGSNSITKDIKEGASIMPDRAEKLKVKFGSAMAQEVYDNTIISIPGIKGHEHKEISEKNLARIIQARMEEILDYVVAEIKRSGYSRKLPAGIVLTGGGALLRHIDKLTAYHSGMITRIGHPLEQLANGYSEDMTNPDFATAMGLLMHGLKKPYHTEEEDDFYNSTQIETPEPVVQEADGEKEKMPWMVRLMEKAKEIFKEESDSRF